jgi:hypothetical protein
MQDSNAEDDSPTLVTSETAFALWGVEDVAYIKLIAHKGETAWAIFAADGTALGAMPTRDLAFAAAMQNDRNAFSVH